MNTNKLLDIGSSFLKKNKISSYNLDSEIILSNILDISREKLLTKENNVSNQTVNSKTCFEALRHFLEF